MVDLTGRLKKLIKGLREEMGTVRKEQQIYFASAGKMTENASKRNNDHSGLSKEIAQCKEKIEYLSGTVKISVNENEMLKKAAEQEKKFVTELGEIIKKMKGEIAEQAKECGKLRKDLVVGDHQLEQLQQKCDKYV